LVKLVALMWSSSGRPVDPDMHPRTPDPNALPSSVACFVTFCFWRNTVQTILAHLRENLAENLVREGDVGPTCCFAGRATKV